MSKTAGLVPGTYQVTSELGSKFEMGMLILSLMYCRRRRALDPIRQPWIPVKTASGEQLEILVTLIAVKDDDARGDELRIEGLVRRAGGSNAKGGDEQRFAGEINFQTNEGMLVIEVEPAESADD